MPIEYLMFWMRETLSNVLRNRLMSLLAISTVTIGLFILGAFYLTIANLRAVVSSETQKLDLAVILKRDVSPRRRKEIFEGARIPQVKKVVFVSRDKILAEFKRENPNLPLEDFKG